MSVLETELFVRHSRAGGHEDNASTVEVEMGYLQETRRTVCVNKVEQCTDICYRHWCTVQYASRKSVVQ